MNMTSQPMLRMKQSSEVLSRDPLNMSSSRTKAVREVEKDLCLLSLSYTLYTTWESTRNRLRVAGFRTIRKRFKL